MTKVLRGKNCMWHGVDNRGSLIVRALSSRGRMGVRAKLGRGGKWGGTKHRRILKCEGDWN